jgi:hypothetical protein
MRFLTGPSSKFVHIGGDEVKFDCWKSDAKIAAHVTKLYGDTSPASFSRLQAEWTANVSSAAVKVRTTPLFAPFSHK